MILSLTVAYAADDNEIRKECRQNCRNDFKDSVENCDDVFQNNKTNCKSNATINFIDCKKKASDEHSACIENSSAKLVLCLASCKIEKPVTIPPGFDIFETPNHNSFLDLNLPASFFDPGSDPFSGRVEFVGEPLNPPVFGTTDTIVERKESAVLHSPFFNDTIPIEIVSLSLVSTNPITVTYLGNTSPELWRVRIVVSPSKPSDGSITIKRNNTQGGTFDSSFFVQPEFTFQRLKDNEMRTLDTGNNSSPYQLNANNSPWRFEPCHQEVLRVPDFTSNFCPSSTSLGRELTSLTGINAQHSIKPATKFYGLQRFGCRAPFPAPLLVFNPDFNRNLTPFSQYNRTLWGNQSCGPTCAGVILEYWNRTGFPSIMGNYSLGDLIDRLRNLSGTTEENGTSVFGLVDGITRHLRNRSFAVNFTVTVFESDPNQADGTTTFDGQQNGVGVTSKIDNNFTFTDLTREMANETVIILLEGTQGGHFVAANDYTRNANNDGSHNISIMDPAEGQIINVRMYGSFIELGTENWTIVSVISVSPVNALLDSDSDGVPDIRETACADSDGDGYGSHCALGDDCDDSNSGINPAAQEICDQVDNDCDGVIDEHNVCCGNNIIDPGEQCDPPTVEAPPPVLICPPGQIVGQGCGPNCQFVDVCVPYYNVI